ncbi:hypothetical protein CALCODRAFT_513668, partial [Calocera cornea HHB12733]
MNHPLGGQPTVTNKPSILYVTAAWMRTAKIGAVMDLFAKHGAIVIRGALPNEACLSYNKDALRQDPFRDGAVIRRAQLQCDVPDAFNPFLERHGTTATYIDLSLDDLLELRDATQPYPPVISLLSYPRGHIIRHVGNRALQSEESDNDVNEYIPFLRQVHDINDAQAWDALGHLPRATEDLDPPSAISAWEMWQLRGSYHPPHMDFGGTCTGVLMLSGEKVWMHFDSTHASAQLHLNMAAQEPFPNTLGVGVLLRAGDAMFTAPRLHSVISTKDCIVKGSNFYSMVQMRETLRA